MSRTYKISLGYTHPSTGFKEIFRADWAIAGCEEELEILMATVSAIMHHTGRMGLTPLAAFAKAQPLEGLVMHDVIASLNGKTPLRRMTAPIDDLIPNYGALIDLRAPGVVDISHTFCFRINSLCFLTQEEKKDLLLVAPDGLEASAIGKEVELGSGRLTLDDLVVLHDLAGEARERGKAGFCVVGPEDDDRVCLLS